VAGRSLRRAAALSAACAALGAAAADDGARWYLQVDNDAFFNTDRWYTSGLRIARVVPRGDHDDEWGVLQEIYTPEAKFANPVDRPPAARLLATYARHERTPGDWTTFEVDVGVTGPSALGEEAQKIAHKIVHAPHENWDLQRPDQLDGDIVYARTLTLPLRPAGWGVAAHYGGLAGNQLAYVHGGLELRYGHGAALDIFSPIMRYAASPPFPRAAPDGSWSVFAGATARAVLMNHLLDFQDGSTTPPLDRKDVVGRLVLGGTWYYRHAAVSFAVAQETKEFAGQRRNHDFGSLTLHIPF
jgi:hypothetical protein